MEQYPGISIWDFAYPAGKCSLAQGEKKSNYFLTKEPPSHAHRKSRESTKSFCNVVANAIDASTMEPDVDVRGRTKTDSKSKSKSKHHRRDTLQTRTYLLSIPIPSRLFCTHIKATISTLLMEPHTQLILLVPQSHIVCPKVCELQRFPKAGGSGIQVLPIPPTIAMECAIEEDDGSSIESSLELLAIDEVAKKLVKCTKVKRFDGYLAFEDERASWLFLEKVGKAVASLVGTK